MYIAEIKEIIAEEGIESGVEAAIDLLAYTNQDLSDDYCDMYEAAYKELEPKDREDFYWEMFQEMEQLPH